MNYKIPGVTSIVLGGAAFGLAVFLLLQFSIILGVVYLLFMPIMFLNILYQYCRKCPHVPEGTCRHVLFGAIVKRFFTAIEPALYTQKELIRMIIPFVLYILFPQYWLFQHTSLFILYWGLMASAITIIRLGVCTSCKNSFCFFCKNKEFRTAGL